MQNKTPAREFWDFCSCPPDERYFCLGYEYARHIEHIVHAYREDSKTGGHFDLHGNWWYLLPISHPTRFTNPLALFLPAGDFLLMLPPGFPDTPYLKTRRVVDAVPVDLRKILLGSLPTVEDSKDVASGVGEEAMRKELFINWNAPDKVLIAGFAKWLKRKGVRPSPAVEHRGKAALPRQLEHHLKALSAWRLLKSLTIEDATRHTMSLEMGVRGLGLYGDYAKWSEARKHAETFAEVLNTMELPAPTDEETSEWSRQFQKLLFR